MYLHADHNTSGSTQSYLLSNNAICAVGRDQDLPAIFVLRCLDDNLVGLVNDVFDSLSFTRDNSAFARAYKKTVIELLSAYDAKVVDLFVS